MRPADLHSALVLSNAQELVKAVSRDFNGDLPQSRAYDCMDEKWIDPRDDDPTKEGIFRDHNCWKCQNGKLPCVTPPGQGGCEYPRARND